MYFLPWEQEAGGSNPLAPTTFSSPPSSHPRRDVYAHVSRGGINKLFQRSVLSFIFIVFDFGFSSDSGLKSREHGDVASKWGVFVRGREHGYTNGKSHGK